MHADPLDPSANDRPRRVARRGLGTRTPKRPDSRLIDWTGWLRLIERKRRLLSRAGAPAPEGPTGVNGDISSCARGRPVRALPDVVALTYSSFKLDGWDVTPQQVRGALSPSSTGRATPELRSRQAQRLRNHASILHHIESSLRVGEPLKTHVVVRWFTHVSSGLTGSGLDDEVIARLDQVVRRINSPQLRLQPALMEICVVHADVQSEPLMPSYNGIVSRLLLRYHLGRCNLPPIVFDPAVDGPALSSPDDLLRTMLKRIEESYARLLA